ncbi:DUF922 domain-containing Zn-dependent protease [Mucilaginibacter sp. BJC16-A38]|uniref:DUF922 domain-containing Zn-dependent protease n=1 Tax=Mucilaginibacter phenanthrenivorans TaxID=1234842 RepID=UPI0021575E7A|nr:DUF922 domain-containing Zn-dependent protease [Mucilaginibacter phenanthrenivorans]MCR8557731.1 DUF922 domain-containing Zn-dependent protease [Mucilaginibacter phenanthrenivorans]
MKLGFVRLICLAAAWLFITNSASAQAYRQLTAYDFQGVPHPEQGKIAYTNCSIYFHYEAHRERTYYRLNFDIRLTMNNYKSWMDKQHVSTNEMLAEVLKHEQGHYAIAFMEQQELLRTVGKTVFYADYQYVAQSIFDRIDAKYRQLNLDYDADTNHMRNRVQQQSWDTYFKKRLEYMPPE